MTAILQFQLDSSELRQGFTWAHYIPLDEISCLLYRTYLQTTMTKEGGGQYAENYCFGFLMVKTKISEQHMSIVSFKKLTLYFVNWASKNSFRAPLIQPYNPEPRITLFSVLNIKETHDGTLTDR